MENTLLNHTIDLKKNFKMDNGEFKYNHMVVRIRCELDNYILTKIFKCYISQEGAAKISFSTDSDYHMLIFECFIFRFDYVFLKSLRRGAEKEIEPSQVGSIVFVF